MLGQGVFQPMQSLCKPLSFQPLLCLFLTFVSHAILSLSNPSFSSLFDDFVEFENDQLNQNVGSVQDRNRESSNSPL